MTHPGLNARSADHQRNTSTLSTVTRGLHEHVPVQRRLQAASDSQVTRFCGLPMTKASILSIN
jgi:hypothetical protein